ncbi:MAG TPA: disulfide bond formation protein B [Rickettsiales bacterium]|nr:disulfide bond formation protein B [Rickettsiales bacterium]
MNTGILRFSLVASLLSLGGALAVQYWGGLAPCHLCTIQRIPYVAVIVLSLVGIAIPAARKCKLSWLIMILFLSGAGVAAYHAGVEKHLIAGPSSCTSSSGAGQSVDDLLQKIKSAPIVACDQPQWEFHGITLSLLNMIWSLALAFYVAAAARKKVDNAQASR